MAFYELLISRQQHLIPQPLPNRPRIENPVSSVMQFVLENVKPGMPEVFFALDGSGGAGCLGSPSAIWTVVHIVNRLTQSQVLNLDWCELKLIVSLYALLEVTCAQRCFPGGTHFRALAAPREAECFVVGVEDYIVDVLEAMLFLTRSLPDRSSERLLQWILLSRALLAGSQVAVELDESERNQRLRVATWAANYEANKEAFANASQIFLYSTSLRWQVKSQAVKIATTAVEELASMAGHDPELLNTTPSFNPVVAKAVLEQANTTFSGTPQSHRSFLVLHLGELLTAACTASVATLDQSELRWLQVTSIHFLAKLIELFGNIEDPEQPNSCILSQYSTQVVSSVRHALTAPDEDSFGSSKRLFLAGCVALQAICRSGLSEDTAMLKRMVRLIVPDREEIPFFEYANGLRDEEPAREENIKLETLGSSQLPTISKLWTLGLVCLTSDPIEPVVELPRSLKVGIAIHSAAVAMDGSRLLLGSGFSLCGVPNEESANGKEEESSADCQTHGGFLYGNIKDIDDSVKSTLASSWSPCGANALSILVDILSSKEDTDESHSSCLTWLKSLVPLIFAGVLTSFPTGNDGRDRPRLVGWVPLLDCSEVVADCLCGLSALAKGAGEVALEDAWHGELESVSSVLLSEVLSPVLPLASKSNGDVKDTVANPLKRKLPQRLVIESCRLIETLAASKTLAQRERPCLMMAVLGPLDAVQSGTVQFTDPVVDIIIASSLNSASSLVKLSSSSDTLIKAMLQVATEHLQGAGSDKVKESAKELLGCVFHHNSVTLPMQERIADDVATAGNWAAWSALCRASADGHGVSNSLSIVQEQLVGYDFPEQQMAALTAVRQVVQQLASSPVVGRILHAIGPEVFGILHAYGTLRISDKNYSYRTVACADAVKVVLVAYQQLASEEDKLPTFLTVLFASFINTIRFNGLPNHPSPQTGADAALGRMSAQSIMYVARTTPSAFKASLAALSEHDRAVLELAVRAEMSGYATTVQAAPKRIIDLKGFKSSAAEE
jgi:hypothetical protein